MIPTDKDTTIDVHEEVVKAVEAFRMGKVVLYPTDTIWGLGCDMTNKSAVEQIYRIKERPREQPLIVLVSDIQMLKKYVRLVHPRIETLLVHHNKPLTIIYDQLIDVPDYMKSPEGSLAIRVCQDEFCSDVIRKFGAPIVSTSANKSGSPTADCFDQIDPQIIEEADYVVGYGQDDKEPRMPSIIARYSKKGELIFIRE